MKTKFLAILLLLTTIAGLAVGATSWNEIEVLSNIAPDPKTGGSALYFTVILEYDPLPSSFRLETSWTLFSLQDGKREIIQEYTKQSRASGRVRRIYSMSPALPVEAGMHYGAEVRLEDTLNGLVYQKSFDYLVPTAVPVGLRLTGWDGTEAVDLTGVPDEELEQLATLHRLLGQYERSAEDASLDAFLSTDLPDEEAFPALVLLVPNAGVSSTLGPSNGGPGITLTVGQTFVLYAVPNRTGAPSVMQQLSVYEKDFVGDVYRGDGDLGFVQGVRVFVGPFARLVLDAAAAEWSRRTA